MRSKALSPVIAVILMVAVAVAAAVLAYTWGVAFQARTQAQVGERAGAVGGYAIKIENADANATSGLVRVYVRNIGDADVPEGTWVLYVNGTSCGTTTASLTSGQVSEFNCSTSLTAGEEYRIKITGPEGVTDQTTVKAVS